MQNIISLAIKYHTYSLIKEEEEKEKEKEKEVSFNPPMYAKHSLWL